MFDIGWGELLVIGIVALIAIGPKELPGALRTLGQWMGKVRRMANEFQYQFQEAMREAEMADIKKQVDTLTSGFDPIETARKEIETAMEDKPSSPSASPDQAGVPATPAPPEATAPPDHASANDIGGGTSAAPLAPGANDTVRSADSEPVGGEAKPETAGGRPA